MAPRHSRVIVFLCVLLLAAGLVSCIKVRPPGIMPPVQDGGGSQWKVLHKGFLMVKTSDGSKQWRWQIIARFIPEEAGPGLKPLDITAAVDGTPVPFTYEEDGHLFESVTSSALSAGVHTFELAPSENPSRSFPTLMVEFEAP